MNIYRIIQLDERSVTPKYLQLANAIMLAAENGKLAPNDPLPSINDLSFELDISRDTAEKAYRHLKQLGIIGSVPGKGYFILKTEIANRLKVLLLFNKLSAHKKIIYDSFVETLGTEALIDFYIYNNDFSLFKKILKSKKDQYTHYVIIPHFMETGHDASELLNEIKQGQLVLLDKEITGIDHPFGAVYEDFDQDIFNALTQALPQLTKYHTLKIIFPSYTYFPDDILKGFRRFCQQYAFQHEVVSDISSHEISAGEVYINLMEDDLVTLLGKVSCTDLEPGKNIGIISYNETPWKQFILNGITTISTDFRVMGELAAQLVATNNNEKKKVPFTLTLRSSL